MTLKEKYTIKNKKRMKQCVFLYSILIIFLVMYSTLARYEKTSEGYTKIAVADWKISLNGQELTSDKNELKDTIKLIPITNKDETNPNKIKPGQEGFFDITIDPTGTEVSFDYEIALNEEQSILPEGFEITKYSISGEDEEKKWSENKKLTGTIGLGNDGTFGEEDIKKIRYYWKWKDEIYEEAEYKIIADVKVEQVI